MSLSFRLPCSDEATARSEAAELAAALTLEPVQVERVGSQIRIEVDHPLATALAGMIRFACCGLERLSVLLCQTRGQDCKSQGSTGI